MGVRWMSEIEYTRRRLRVIVLSMILGAVSTWGGVAFGNMLVHTAERSTACHWEGR